MFVEERGLIKGSSLHHLYASAGGKTVYIPSALIKTKQHLKAKAHN